MSADSTKTPAAKTTTSAEEVVNKLFEDKLKLADDMIDQMFVDEPNPDLKSDDKPEALSDDDAEEFSDALTNDEHATEAKADESEPTADENDDEDAPRRAHERTLSAEQLADNQRKAVDIKDFGNVQFKNDEFHESLQSYSEALDICPLSSVEQRSVLFGNRAAAHIQLANSADALADCNRSLKLNPNYLKVVLRRAKLHEDADKLDESLADYKHALELNANATDAQHAVHRLTQKIDERNEKLKTEMLGKLKDLGNMVLRPFGLSTDNFQMKQDPATGSYSVNFQQK